VTNSGGFHIRERFPLSMFIHMHEEMQVWCNHSCDGSRGSKVGRRTNTHRTGSLCMRIWLTIAAQGMFFNLCMRIWLTIAVQGII
jgi:hypothetical protein